MKKVAELLVADFFALGNAAAAHTASLSPRVGAHPAEQSVDVPDDVTSPDQTSSVSRP